jgi:hypothetical protein
LKLDAVLIAFGYREMDELNQPDAISSPLFATLAARSLKGMPGVVDFLPGSGGPGPEPQELGRARRGDQDGKRRRVEPAGPRNDSALRVSAGLRQRDVPMRTVAVVPR